MAKKDMVKVKVILPFFDKVEDIARIPKSDTGVFEATQERFDYLKANLPEGYVDLVDDGEAVETEAPKKKAVKSKKAEG